VPIDAEQNTELARRFAAGEKLIAVSAAMRLPVADVISAWLAWRDAKNSHHRSV